MLKMHAVRHDGYIMAEDMYFDVKMESGALVFPWITALGAFWPGMQVLYGHVGAAARAMTSFINTWNAFGFIPEALDVQRLLFARPNMAAYHLRPEMAESLLLLHRATKDSFWLYSAHNMVRSIQHSAWVRASCSMRLCVSVQCLWVMCSRNDATVSVLVW